MIPSGAPRYIARKTAQLRQRRHELIVQLGSIDAELRELAQAQETNHGKLNGQAARVLGNLIPLKITQKDLVLRAIKSRPKSGIARPAIIEKLAKQNHPISANSVSTYLARLREEGLVRQQWGLWFPTEE